MRFRGWLTLGLAAYLAFVLITFPASVVVTPVLAKAPGVYGNVSGTLWNGAIEGLSVRGEALPVLRWHLHPLALLMGRASADLELGEPDGELWARGRVSASLGGTIRAEALEGRIPAARVAPYMRVPNLVLGGDFELHLEQFAAQGQRLDALAGSLVWNKGHLESPYGRADLGSQSVQVTRSAAGGIDGVLSELSGPMDLKGEFHWQPSGEYRSDGSVKEQLPSELKQFFALVARPDGQGRLAFHYQGRFLPR